ncbi:MAG TPA: DUF3592 domain-containing protein [Humisphaera sp.]
MPSPQMLDTPQPRQPRRIYPWIALGLVTFGAVFVTIGGFAWRSSAKLAKDGLVADAVVTQVDEVHRPATRDREAGVLYYPHFRFTDAAGQTHDVASSTGQYPAAYAKGDRLKVRYLPARPQEAEADTWTSLWLFPVVFVGVGSLVWLAAAVVVVVARRLPPPPEPVDFGDAFSGPEWDMDNDEEPLLDDEEQTEATAVQVPRSTPST